MSAEDRNCRASLIVRRRTHGIFVAQIHQRHDLPLRSKYSQSFSRSLHPFRCLRVHGCRNPCAAILSETFLLCCYVPLLRHCLQLPACGSASFSLHISWLHPLCLLTFRLRAVFLYAARLYITFFCGFVRPHVFVLLELARLCTAHLLFVRLRIFLLCISALRRGFVLLYISRLHITRKKPFRSVHFSAHPGSHRLHDTSAEQSRRKQYSTYTFSISSHTVSHTFPKYCQHFLCDLPQQPFSVASGIQINTFYSCCLPVVFPIRAFTAAMLHATVLFFSAQCRITCDKFYFFRSKSDFSWPSASFF